MPEETGNFVKRQTYQKVGFVLGPIAFAILLAMPVPNIMEPSAWHVIAIAAFMAIWWGTEAIPIPATSLIPVVAFPLLNVTTLREATVPYAGPVIFLLLGGFIIAMAMQRWGLHKRIALLILLRFHGSAASLIFGFMVAAALLSMWVSNTATTLMMIPIAISVADAIEEGASSNTRFATALVLGIAYAASIGGLGTLVGTPPNAMVAAYISQTFDIQIGFTAWMAFALPIVFVMIPTAWFVLTRMVFHISREKNQKGQETIHRELNALGPISKSEKRTLLTFVFIALLWVFRPLIDNIPGLTSLTDTGIAIGGAVAMFLIPAGNQKGDFLLNWDWAVKIPWGVLLLFGGGLSLAAAVSSTGLAGILGGSLAGLTNLHLYLLIILLVAMVIFLTELTSNTATTAGLLPVLGAVATIGEFDPILLAAPAAMAASCAFMLPVATAPNAIVFAGGKVTIPQMVAAGLRLNIAGIAIISTLCYVLLPRIFG